MITEIWKDVRGFEGLYKASDLGRVKSVLKEVSCHIKYKRIQQEVILKPSIKNNGYAGYSLYKNGKVSYMSAHRIIAISFLENEDNKKEVNHKDGNRLNNKLENLEWNTRSENVYHSFLELNRSTGLGSIKARGFKHGASIKVNQLDMNRNIIKTWDCMNDAKREGYGIGNIFSCCNGKRKTHKGFIWEYA